jgi:hypothetical protein
MELKQAQYNGREYVAVFHNGVTVVSGGDCPGYTEKGKREFYGLTVSSPERAGEWLEPHDCMGGVERDPSGFQLYIDAAIAAWQEN